VSGDDDLTLIPRAVRDKLDRVGIKIHLKQWELFTLDERRALVAGACDSPAEIDRYRTDLADLVRRRTGREPERLTR